MAITLLQPHAVKHDQHTEARTFCYDMLDEVSRSFAMVIRQLPEDLKDPVCVFYLVLRGLDTIEDDTDLSLDYRTAYMQSFCQKLGNTEARFVGIGDRPAYQKLLHQFGYVNVMLNRLASPIRQVIIDKCHKMAKGMIRYAERPIADEKDYDEYCYYVAGLVGEGLSELFMATGHEHGLDKDNHVQSIAMGLFLQKTNITRDIFEDLPAGRLFWPKSIYAPFVHRIEDLPRQEEAGRAVLRAMVLNALNHLKDCRAYLAQLKNPKVLRFCAIPQIMAFDTLRLVYDNPDTYHKNIKIPRIRTLQLSQRVRDVPSVLAAYDSIAQKMIKAHPGDTELKKALSF